MAKLDDIVEFVPIDPTFKANGPPEANVYEVDPTGPYYEWFNFDENNPFNYKGLDQTIERICNTLRSDGPFDGLLGFSQGGAVTSYLVKLALEGDKRLTNTFRFAILVSAFPPRDASFTAVSPLIQKFHFPSLHIFGTQDRILKYCKIGVEMYHKPTVIIHSRAHAFPKCEGEVQQKVMEFLAAQLQESGEVSPPPSNSKL